MEPQASRVILWPERALILSMMGRVQLHAHNASCLLMGVNGTFGFRHHAETWITARNLWVSMGCMHELACGDTMMAVLFVAPGRLDHDTACLTHNMNPLAAYQSLTMDQNEAMRAVLAGELQEEGLDGWLHQTLGPHPTHFAHETRVNAAARMIRQRIDQGWTLEMLAQDLHLSPSRLRHLFRARTQITPQQFKLWYRMHAVTCAMANDQNLTHAAHAAGFTDSAHLSRSFKRLFGLPPSRILRPSTAFIVRP